MVNTGKTIGSVFIKAMMLLAGYAAAQVAPLSGQQLFPTSWQVDANLRDVKFVDIDFGWAVGDRGTLLKTEDGGRNWVSISQPRDLIWSGISIDDERVCRIAGGYYLGALPTSVGLIIQSHDGGKTWKDVSPPGIRFVRQIKFFDSQTGWIQCDPSELYPGGMLATNDGGETWQAVQVSRANMGGENSSSSFRAIEAITPRKFWGVAGSGRYFFSERELTATQSHFDITCLASTQSGSAIRAGKKGRIEQSSNLLKWNSVTLDVGQQNVDWNAAAVFGERIWLVGSPGSLIARSDDGGKSWQTFRTPETTSLKAVTFLNRDRGWAVGSLGKILHTKDGGETWTVQRGGGQRVAATMLHRKIDAQSIQVLALISGTMGKTTGMATLGEAQSAGASDNPEVAARSTQLVNRAGVSTLSNLTLNPQEIVRHLRMNRPSVLVTQPLDSRYRKIIEQAVADCESAEFHPELLELGLLPWKIEKWIEVDSESGNRLVLDQFSAGLGRSVSEQASFALTLLAGNVAAQKAIGWQVVQSKSDQGLASQSPLSGTTAMYERNCQRTAAEVTIDNLQAFRSISKREATLARLELASIDNALQEKAWLEQITAATSGMDALSYASFLEDLSKRYSRSGQAEMSDRSEQLIFQRLPDSEAGISAMLRLIHRYSSHESVHSLQAQYRKRQQSQSGVQTANHNRPDSGQWNDPRIQPASHETPLPDVNLPSLLLGNANQLIENFQTRFPSVAISPQFEYLAAGVRMKAGKRTTMDRIVDSANPGTATERWAARIEKEKVFRKVELQSALNPFRCQVVSGERIKLDGNLNERNWSKDRSIQFAYDQQYLYFAIKMKRQTGMIHEAKRNRVRDEILDGFDRVVIRLDTDRDYSSAFELVVDERGCCNDLVWRDPTTRDHSWNPTWYVASGGDQTYWQIEAAIPLSELGFSGATTGNGWMVESFRMERTQRDIPALFDRDRNRIENPFERFLIFQ